MKYAVTGATGKFGQTAVNELLKLISDDDQVIALARNIDKAKHELSHNVDIRPGDYTKPDELKSSLAGVDKLLFISSLPGQKVARLTQHQNIVQAADQANVKFIAYTSFPHADEAQSGLSSDHQATEKLIKDHHIQHAFLRNNWYLQNEMATIQPALHGHPFIYAAGDQKVGWALEADYAKAAAKVLTFDQPKSVYEFSGKGHTYHELAQSVAKVSGKQFDVQSLNLDQYESVMKKAGMDSNVAKIVTSIQELIRNGELAKTSDDLEHVLGHPLPSLKDELKQILK
ncbi:NAD(P)-dependent oxidoreductase [Philodulcilactobacillus myokoensis]|uniref:NAD(P)-dependent oxidoreductase n=1 Tax=Philodulcilactobacillus myokoensis TaxID=2929573 RepID=A0A9W6AZK3_9LACO|nr:SDR family oxidoreductase [Philodulcilactobacillus myokoensis]GLB46136.1 NAD(P)-dependent oxidoreductase [Philodulcilactobacillus myokoensis]